MPLAAAAVAALSAVFWPLALVFPRKRTQLLLSLRSQLQLQLCTRMAIHVVQPTPTPSPLLRLHALGARQAPPQACSPAAAAARARAPCSVQLPVRRRRPTPPLIAASCTNRCRQGMHHRHPHQQLPEPAFPIRPATLRLRLRLRPPFLRMTHFQAEAAGRARQVLRCRLPVQVSARALAAFPSRGSSRLGTGPTGCGPRLSLCLCLSLAQEQAQGQQCWVSLGRGDRRRVFAPCQMPPPHPCRPHPQAQQHRHRLRMAAWAWLGCRALAA